MSKNERKAKEKIMVPTCNLSSWEVEARESGVKVQPELWSDFVTHLEYMMRPGFRILKT